MKKGDIWNWAFVMAGLMLIAMDLWLRRLQLRFADVGGYHNNVSMGLAVFGMPIMTYAPILLLFAGVAAACGKRAVPLIGVALGLGLYYPMLCLILVVRTVAFALLPSSAGAIWPAAGLALLVLGIVKKPKEKKRSFQQSP